MELHALDWTIIVGYFAVALGVGLWFKARAGKSLADYFASGRSLPWWLAGTSMVATTFAADTPLVVTGLIARNGLAGNWFWWAFAFGGMLTVFVFAKLWRRAEVLTDVELIEMRYAGRPAAFLRGFRAVYVAVVVNSFVIGWVTQAMLTVLRNTVLVDLPQDSSTDLLLIAGLLLATGSYSVISGMWGVAVTDALQFTLAMVGCIALAWLAVDHVGGIDAMQERATANFGGTQLFDFVPDFSGAAWMPLGVFLALVLGQWWATWYPGAEPGGGGYIVQRMASCRNERDAVKATLLFQLAHYCVRPWPWILVAFAALALHPELRTWALADAAEKLPPAGSGFPMLIRELAPVGLRGLLLVTFFAAYMSTISTQMNWGASYVVNDLYKRFVAPSAGDRQLVRASRVASVLVLTLGAVSSWIMAHYRVSPDEAWAVLAALGGGLGSVFLLRWFWWRVNAWSEIAAMSASLVMFGVVTLFPFGIAGEYTSLIVAGSSLVVWLAATYLTRPEPREHLVAFYRKVRPDGPGWGPVAAAAPDVRPDRSLARNLACAVLGTTVIWLTLPGIGAVIFGDLPKAAMCLLGAALAGAGLFALLARTTAAAAVRG
ncbi:MAG TPA: sodium:solute symporter family protein [Planctomycetota bacterium]|nr:sodium:solute symporter family protein [Planctomycetota bacterium]